MSTANHLTPMTEKLLLAMTPKDANDRLVAGNKRFLDQLDPGQVSKRNLNDYIDDTSSGQYPFALVLSCIDSRMPTETLFDQSIGDIFNTRIAGNFVNEDILGGMEFACSGINSAGDYKGVRLILVLGHTSCGAVNGAFQTVYPNCFNIEPDGSAPENNLTRMLERLTPAVKATSLNVTDWDSCSTKEWQSDFVNQAARTNVRLTINNILIQSADIRNLYNSGEINIVGAMYHIDSGTVEFLDDE